MDLILILSATLLGCILHYFTQRIFIYFKRFDDFNDRSSHKTLATRTGGIGIFSTLLFISIYFYFQNIEIFDYSLFIPLSIMFIVGVYDDLYRADFKLKFLLQIIVAKILIDQGYAITNYHGLFGLYEIPWFLAQMTTIFVFLIIVNSINFIDGVDGLAITEFIKIIIVIEMFSTEHSLLAPMGLILMCSIIPLYYFNFKTKRKVFLGDAGSLLLGTIVAIYIFFVLGNQYTFKTNFNINKTIFAILVIIYPLTDLLRVFIIRLINKKSPFEPDQNHLHHLILKKGYKSYKIVLIILLISFLPLFFASFF